MDFVDAAQQPLVDATAKLGLGPRSAVDARAFARVTEAKARGNALFGTARFVDAIGAYDEALGFFGLYWGSVDQRDEKVKIYSNRAECELKLGRWKEAAASAAAALGITPGHTKSLLRRARAYTELGELAKAEADVAALRASGGTTTRDLAPVVARIKARRKGAGPASPGGASRAPKGAGPASPGGASRAPAPAPRRPRVEALPTGFTGNQLPAASAWSRGLEGRRRVEWFVNCYRMRVDDDYAVGGEVRRGTLYDPDHSGRSVFLDFVIFCKLAIRNQAVPDPFNWVDALAVAAELIPCAFEKSDAKEKYGSENIFDAATGGRSLRYTGSIIYGYGPDGYVDPELDDIIPNEMRLARRAAPTPDRSDAVDLAFDAAYFADVGGVEPWRRLYAALVGLWGVGDYESDYDSEDDEDDYYEDDY